MLETFERLAEQEPGSRRTDPFVRSHPVAADRLRQLREKVAASPYADQKDPPELQLRHDMMRAKLDGHMLPAQLVFNRYPANNNSLPARYARAIARNCSSGCTPSDGRRRCADPRAARQPLFLGAEGPGAAHGRAYGEAIAPLRKAASLLEQMKGPHPGFQLADPDHAGPGDGLLERSAPAGRGDPILTHVVGADKPLWQGEDDDWLGWWHLAEAY